MAKAAKKLFQDTTLPKNDSGQHLSSDQVIGNSDVSFSKRSKNLIFCPKMDYLDRKGAEMDQTIFFQKSNFLFHEETMTIAQKQNMAMEHQNIGRK